MHIFYRADNRDAFIYADAGQATQVEDGPPIEIRWVFPPAAARWGNRRVVCNFDFAEILWPRAGRPPHPRLPPQAPGRDRRGLRPQPRGGSKAGVPELPRDAASRSARAINRVAS